MAHLRDASSSSAAVDDEQRAKLHRIRISSADLQKRTTASSRRVPPIRKSVRAFARSRALSVRSQLAAGARSVRRRRQRNAREPLPLIMAIRGGRVETRGERKEDGTERMRKIGRERERDFIIRNMQFLPHSSSITDFPMNFRSIFSLGEVRR